MKCEMWGGKFVDKVAMRCDDEATKGACFNGRNCLFCEKHALAVEKEPNAIFNLKFENGEIVKMYKNV